MAIVLAGIQEERRGIFKPRRKRHGKLAGRVATAEQDFGHCPAHALPSEKRGQHGRHMRQPRHLDRVRRRQNNHGPRVYPSYLLDQGVLPARQMKIGTVGAFSVIGDIGVREDDDGVGTCRSKDRRRGKTSVRIGIMSLKREVVHLGVRIGKCVNVLKRDVDTCRTGGSAARPLDNGFNCWVFRSPRFA